MVATFDVLIFIVLLSAVAASLVSFNSFETDTPDASQLCEDIFSLEIKSDDFLSNGDTVVYRLSDYAAMSLMNGDIEFINANIAGILDDLLDDRYGYHLSMNYKNEKIEIGKRFDSPLSVCKTEFDVIGPEDLSVELSLYGY